jgi:S-adenosylmethionine hydrolase
MRGVIKCISPEVEVVELSTEVKPFAVKSGAFVLYSSFRYYPLGTIHLAVVDPGVGSQRKAIAVKTRNYLFVGPDNGLLIPAAREDEIVQVRELTNRSLFLNSVSRTFHGRDVFAPVAAFLSKGGAFEEVGDRLDCYTDMSFFKSFDGGVVVSEILFEDKFGNLTISLAERDTKLEDEMRVSIKGRYYRAKCVNTYAEGDKGLMLLVGSEGFYEIAVKNGSASQLTGASLGDKVTITAVS